MAKKNNNQNSSHPSDKGSIGFLTFDPTDSIKKVEEEIRKFPEKQPDEPEDQEDNEQDK